MKRVLILSVFVIVFIHGITSLAESADNTNNNADEIDWICPACGSIAIHNYCSNCGAEKPEMNSDPEIDDSRTLSFLNSLSEQERSIMGFYKCMAGEEDRFVSEVIEVEPIGENKVVVIDFCEDLLGNITHGSISTSYFNVISLEELFIKDLESVLWRDQIYTRTTNFDSFSKFISGGMSKEYYLQHFENPLIEDAKYDLEYNESDGFRYTFQGEEFIYPNAVALGHVVIEDPGDPESLWWGITEINAIFGTKDGLIKSEELLVDISICIHADYYKFVDDGVRFITGDHIIKGDDLDIFRESTEWKLSYQKFVEDHSYVNKYGYYMIKCEEYDNAPFLCQISLLYIDEDDIPEMVIGLYTNFPLVVSWKPSGLVVSLLQHRITGYIEKGNKFYFDRYGFCQFYNINNQGMIVDSYSGGRAMAGLEFKGFNLNGFKVNKTECIDALRDYYPMDNRKTFMSESYYGYKTFLSF